MMFAVPGATAVTSPWLLTVATAVLFELQVTARPVSVWPFASSVVAVASEFPTAEIELADKVTLTVATGASVTVIDELPLLPSLVAVTVTVPTPVAVTRPLASTAAAAGLLEIHATVLPFNSVPFASRVTAVSC